MSNASNTAFQPDEWVEEKVAEAKQRTRECRADLESSIVRHPVEAVVLAFGAGYLARSLPLGRTASAALRAGLSCVPPVLLCLGAARAWQFLAGSRQALPPRLAPEPGGDPVLTSFPPS